MKWTRRTAALLAALLLLGTVAQARDAAKATSRSRRMVAIIRTEPEEKEAGKMPALTVIVPEVIQPPVLEKLEPEKPEPALTVVEPEGDPPARAEVPSPAPKPDESVSSPVPDPGTPDFPEAEEWQLLLVNPWNEMPEDYEVTLKALPDGQKVDERMYDALNAMLQACRDDGLSPKICSAYRTMSKQTYLYNNKIARLRNAGYSKKAAVEEAGRWVARPGTSEHQLGLAVDIVSSSYQALTKKQEKTAEQKWLIEHCWEYGFILRYPNDKSEITGIGYEPWHYRYVGVDVALDVRKSGLCFEEYLLLREESLAARSALD